MKTWILILVAVSGVLSGFWDSGWGPKMVRIVGGFGEGTWQSKVVGILVLGLGIIIVVFAVSANLAQDPHPWNPLVLPAVWSLVNIPFLVIFYLLPPEGLRMASIRGWGYMSVFILASMVAVWAAHGLDSEIIH